MKNGACRYGLKCSNKHERPKISKTLLLPHLYLNPPIAIAISEG